MKLALSALTLSCMLIPVSALAANDALTGLPLYRGAGTMLMPPRMQGRAIDMCGHKVITTLFETTTPYGTVVGWYKGAMHESPIVHLAGKADEITSLTSRMVRSRWR